MFRTLTLTTALTLAPMPAAAVTFTLFDSGYTQPLFLTGRNNVLYVVEQGGKIFTVNRKTKARTLFFTVPNIETGGEKGLLGFAFDPRYSTNGRFYVNVTTRLGGQLVIEIRRYTDPAKASEATLLILRLAQPFDNHNGGWLDFGPDGNLYIALGDGGSANDPNNNAQNTASLLGKMLRIDVRNDAFPADATRNYAIPITNPFRNEVYAYGLRNPFRASFDRQGGKLWIGDVGQGAVEEVNVIPPRKPGLNFGWRPLEGTAPTSGVGDPIPPNASPPLLSYSHSSGNGASITGGYVYRGTAIPSLAGRYVFGDFISGRVFAATADGTAFDQLPAPPGLNISSFGIDSTRNLYVVDYSGKIFRIDP